MNYMNSEVEEKQILFVAVLVTMSLQGETTVPIYFHFYLYLLSTSEYRHIFLKRKALCVHTSIRIVLDHVNMHAMCTGLRRHNYVADPSGHAVSALA